MSGNIILISDDKRVEEILKPKIILLREVDEFCTKSYSDTDIGTPDVILIYCSEDKEQQERCLDLIRSLKTNPALYATSIILVVDIFNRGFMMNAYAENINDYLLVNSEKSSVLIKLMWAFRQNSLIKELKKRKEFLTDFGVVDKVSGFYSSKYREKIFNHELNYLNTNRAFNSIVLIGAGEKAKATFGYDELVSAVKTSVRASDIVFSGLNEKLYILLPDTPIDKACKLFRKIKLKLNFEVIAAITDISGKSFDIIEKSLLANISKAECEKDKFIIVSDGSTLKNEDDGTWQDWFSHENKTNFKIFKQSYKKKLEKVITPVFYQVQKRYEEKLFEIKIEQTIGESSSKFALIKDEHRSELEVNYNGFSKIHINIVHEGLDSPENQKFDISLPDITEDNITKILEDFIDTYTKFYT